MKILKSFLHLALALLPLTASAGVTYLDESSIAFTVNQARLTNGQVQFASELGRPSHVAMFWNSEIDPELYTRYAEGQTYVVKAAYLIKRGIAELNDPHFFERDNLHVMFPKATVVETKASGWVVQSPLPPAPFGILPPYLECTLTIRHSPRVKPSVLDRNLGAPAAETVQTCIDFNILFDGTTHVIRYYPVDAATTLAVSYETFAIKKSAVEKASYVPFFNLKKRLTSQIKEEMATSIGSLNSN